MNKPTPPTHSQYRLVRFNGSASLGRLRHLLSDMGTAQTPTERDTLLKKAVAVCDAIYNRALKQ